jgi:PAS domain S-box-containing protein
MRSAFKATILNVDDYEPALYTRSRILRQAGFEVQQATTGRDALRLVRQVRPDLVLLDVHLPDMSGFEVCQRIKADPETAATLVVHLSASSTSEADRVRGLELGADTYLIEPIEPDELLANVNALLRIRHAETTLRQREQQLRSILTHAPTVIFLKDAQGRYVHVNRAFEQMTGRTAAEVVGRTAAEVFQPAEAARAAKVEREVVARDQPIDVEERLTVRGETRTYLTVRFPVTGAGSEPYALCGMATDITERKRDDARRAVHHAVTRALLEAGGTDEAAPAILQAVCTQLGWDLGELWVEDDDDRLRLAGAWHPLALAAEGFVARARGTRFARGEGVPGRVWASGAPEWASALPPDIPRAAIAAEHGFRSVLAVPAQNSGTHAVLVFWSRGPREHDERSLETVTVVANQLGEFVARERAERALRASEEAYRAIFERAGLGKAQTELPGGRFLRVNRRLCEFTGYAAPELLRLTLEDVTHPEDRAQVAALLARAARGEIHEHTIETRCVRKDGAVAWGELNLVVLRDEAGRPARSIASIQDVSHRKRIEEERAALLAEAQVARLEAEAQSRAKDEWIAALGHEIRNPLAAIRSAVAVMRNPRLGSEATGRLHDIVDRQLHHLTRLLDDLLDVARLVSGKIVLRRQPVSLLEIVERAVQTVRRTRAAGAHEIGVRGAPVVVDGDPTRLEQIIDNLLDNAVKYTPSGGRIEVDVARAGDAAVLRVRDTGVGMTPEVLHRIFTPFVQAERELDRSEGGLGLGLALVRRLAELHGGTVRASSPGPGLGSEFTVTLPAVERPPAPPAAPDAVPRPGRSRHVLLLEDNEDARDSLQLLLEQWGHRVEVASSGGEGLERIRAARPEIALIDIGLPGLDGYAVARAVRALPGGDRIVLVALTGYGQPQDERRAREAGFDAFLIKPAETADLLGVLETRRPERVAGI